MKGQGLNDLPRCELERRSSHYTGIFFEVPYKKSVFPAEQNRPDVARHRARTGKIALVYFVRISLNGNPA
jgi:hypothetical protein